jgi:flagellar M-ring protein FliF
VSAFNDFWQGLDRGARFGLIVGVVVVVLATVALGFWALQTNYQVLFADLAPQDAATMVAELDRMKTPYRLSEGGSTILVPGDVVYQTRLKLVGRDLPLRGAVGFELFNDSEVGMTEFAQKVNYQRALQGELTRTIQSLDEVQSVRVHLVFSEQALFRKNGTQAKASVTIAVKPGKSLDQAQIQGIQRLVGAAVPDIKPGDVTIVDQHGVALTRPSRPEDPDGAMSSFSLDDKRGIESYLNKKLVEVLDRTFGAGQAIASVDVTLNNEHTKVTTENVLGADGQDDGTTTGVVIRDRRTTRDTSPETDIVHNSPAAVASYGLVNHEVDYQVGRRVEQVVSGAGSIRRINVAVVVRSAMDKTQLDRLKDVVAMAVGFDKDRGDAVAVYPVDQIASMPVNPVAFAAPKNDGNDKQVIVDEVAGPGPAVVIKPAPADGLRLGSPLIIVLAGLLLLSFVLLIWQLTARRDAARPLSQAERERLLAQVQNWLNADARHPPGTVDG